MEVKQTSNRIHPLMAGAAASVMLVSLVGTAAITGLLPSSHSTSAPATEPIAASAQPARLAETAQTQPQTAATAIAPVAPAVVEHRHVVVHKHVPQRAVPAAPQPAAMPQYVQTSTASNEAYRQPQPAQPVQQTAPAAAPTTGVGIAAGAVIGGLLGNQVGGGKGRTLATIAGAVGGGYVGNEVEKRVGY